MFLTALIPDPPALKRLPEFGTSVKMDSNFINSFIKGKSALNDVDSFAVVNSGGNVSFVIGYANTNTNRVNIPVNCNKTDIDKPIFFNANLFREILLANKECSSAILEVSNEGLAKVNFRVVDYDSKYFIVAMQYVD